MTPLSSRLAHLSGVVSLAFLLSCKTAGPTPGSPGPLASGPVSPPETPLAFKPARATRSSVVATLTLAPPMRVLAELNALSDELQMPIRFGDYLLHELGRTLRAEQIPLGAEQIKRMATDLPITAVFVKAGAKTDAELCVAVAFSDQAAALRTRDEIGTVIDRRDGAQARLGPGAVPVWTAVVDRTLLMAPSFDRLVNTAALALEMQSAPPSREQLVATFYPEAVVRAQGLTMEAVEMMARMALFQMGDKATEKPQTRRSQPGRKTPDAPGPKPEVIAGALGALAGPLLQVLKDASSVRLSVDLGAREGLLLGADVVPRPGTPLAKFAASTTPYAIDPVLPIADDRTGVFALGSMRFVNVLSLRLLNATGPIGRSAQATWSAFLGDVAGLASCTLDARTLPLSSLCAWPLKPGANGGKALERYATLMQQMASWESEVMNIKPTPTRIKRARGIIEAERKITASGSAEQTAFARALLGDTVRHAFTVRDGKLLHAQGSNPKAALAALASPGGARPYPPALSRALARTKGYDAMGFMDVMVFVSKGLELSNDPQAKQVAGMFRALPGLSELRLPLVLGWNSGITMRADLQIPMAAFESVATMVRPFMGMLGPPGGAQPNH